MNESHDAQTASINTPCLCMNCGYNLAGLSPTSICPECQFPIQDTILAFKFGGFQSARTKFLAQLGLIAFFLSSLACIIRLLGWSFVMQSNGPLTRSLSYFMAMTYGAWICLLPLSLLWLSRHWNPQQASEYSTHSFKTFASPTTWRSIAWMSLALAAVIFILYFEQFHFNMNRQPSKLRRLIPWDGLLTGLTWCSSLLLGVTNVLAIRAAGRLAAATKRPALASIVKHFAWLPLAIALAGLAYYSLSGRSLPNLFEPDLGWLYTAIEVMVVFIPAIFACILFLHIRRVPAR